MLRLFRRGNLEEQVVVDDLRAIGCIITHTGDDQLEIKVAPHIVAYPDGIIESGVKEAPKTRHILEIKTHNDKSFKALAKTGPPAKHLAQMQTAMHGTGIDRALYVAVNKNTDELYIYRLKYDRLEAEKIVSRGQSIVSDAYAPARIADDPSWYQCKYCPFSQVCYKGEAADKNCRTCAHSTPAGDGSWTCERWGKTIEDDVIEVGCSSYIPHPDMHPGDMVEANVTYAVYEVEGRRVRYGDST